MEQSREMSAGKRAHGSAKGFCSLASGGRVGVSLLTVLLLIVFGVTLTSCSTSGGGGADAEDLSSQKALIWPSPPAPPRISYSKTIATPKDIGAGTGFFRRLADVLFGSAANNMIKPYGLTVDSDGRVLVADTALKRLHIYDVKQKKYSHIESAGDTGFVSIIGVAVDADDNIYLTDSIAAMIYVFNSKGKYIRGFNAGTKPTGLAIDKPAGRLYVVDTGEHNVRMSGLDGKGVKTFGERGDTEGKFSFPVDIFLDDRSDVYVVDTMNYKIQIFDRNGRFISRFGTQGDGSGDFGRPKGIAVDHDGNIYLADALFDTVQIFDREGNYMLNFGSVGNARGAFWMPSGLHIDSGGYIYVADSYNRRVQIFEHLGEGEKIM
ncbi:MAG: 6-bladed beta-propeller [Proteobacteria bacterium]|nr:6-bladed beta-propeller [Pseudomonadota bacterium]